MDTFKITILAIIAGLYIPISLFIVLRRIEYTISISNRVDLLFAWYDRWFGNYFNVKTGVQYYMIPFVGLVVKPKQEKDA